MKELQERIEKLELEREEYKLKLEIAELKMKYNKLLLRLNRGEVYMAGKSEEEINRVMPAFKKLMLNGNKIIDKLKEYGVDATGSVVVDGFEN